VLVEQLKLWLKLVVEDEPLVERSRELVLQLSLGGRPFLFRFRALGDPGRFEHDLARLLDRLGELFGALRQVFIMWCVFHAPEDE
jgi:hypothetical protein